MFQYRASLGQILPGKLKGEDQKANCGNDVHERVPSFLLMPQLKQLKVPTFIKAVSVKSMDKLMADASAILV